MRTITPICSAKITLFIVLLLMPFQGKAFGYLVSDTSSFYYSSSTYTDTGVDINNKITDMAMVDGGTLKTYAYAGITDEIFYLENPVLIERSSEAGSGYVGLLHIDSPETIYINIEHQIGNLKAFGNGENFASANNLFQFGISSNNYISIFNVTSYHGRTSYEEFYGALPAFVTYMDQYIPEEYETFFSDLGGFNSYNFSGWFELHLDPGDYNFYYYLNSYASVNYSFDPEEFNNYGAADLPFAVSDSYNSAEAFFAATLPENINLLGTYGSPPPVPEPCTLLLLGSGLIGLAGFRKKLKK